MMLRARKAEPGAYGETKKPKQFLITDTASAKIDEIAEKLGITRSEVVEWMIRGGAEDAVTSYQATQESIASSFNLPGDPRYTRSVSGGGKGGQDLYYPTSGRIYKANKTR